MVPASRPDCKLRWNIERERVQKNTGERGLDKLNFCQTTLVIFSCHGIFPLKSWDRLQLLPGGEGGGATSLRNFAMGSQEKVHTK